MNFSFGCKRDIKDERDFKLKIRSRVVVSDSADLRTKFPAIRNQGNLGACTSFATTDMAQFVRAKLNFKIWDPSTLFTYYATRKLIGTTDRDSGASVRDALKSTADFGIAKEEHWPYVIEEFAKEPPTPIWDEALEHQSLSYFRVDQTEEAVLNCLSDGYPFTFGMRIYQSFVDSQLFIMRGPVPTPDINTEKYLGGHCMLAVGFFKQDNEYLIIVRNSWGEDFGIDGYVYIPLSILLNSRLSFDFWTLRSSEPDPEDLLPPEPPKPDPIPEPPKPDPIPEPEPPKPDPIPEPPKPPAPDKSPSIWKNPKTWVLIGFGIISLLFVLL